MRVLLTEVIISLKLYCRDRQAMFWTFLFPLLLLILFVSTFGGGNPRTMSGILSGVICISIMTGTLFGIGIVIASARENGILRRYRLTPLPKYVLVFGTIISRYIILFFSMLMLIIVAKVLYRVVIKGDFLSLFIIFSFGTITFSVIGYTIASTAKTAQSASAMANVIFMPMIFVSGSTIPRFLLPKWIQDISNFFPATYLFDAIEEVIVFGGSLWSTWMDLIVLFGFLLVATLTSFKLFRWE